MKWLRDRMSEWRSLQSKLIRTQSEVAELRRRVAELHAVVTDKSLCAAQEYAGVLYDTMSKSTVLAEDHVHNSPDPKLRCAALLILRRDLNESEKLAAICIKSIEDGDREVRAVAIATIGDIYRGSGSCNFTTALFNKVKNREELPHIRKIAYCAVCEILGLYREVIRVSAKEYTLSSADVDRCERMAQVREIQEEGSNGPTKGQ